MTLADSSVILDRTRVLPQHRDAVTLLQARLAAPGSAQTWLDLACGRGQLVQALEHGLTADSRSRLSFVGIDADQRHAREAVRLAESLGLASAEMLVGDLRHLPTLLPIGETVDFITFTNTVHEIAPAYLPLALVTSIARLSEHGALYVADIESIQPLELGAVAWTRDEMSELLGRCLEALGVTLYRPGVQRWQHTTRASWSAFIERQHFGRTSAQIVEQTPTAIAAVLEQVEHTLRLKLTACRTALETLTLYGSETGDEEVTKNSLVYDFWAITRALEALQ